MASGQQVENIAQISDKDKAVVYANELVKEAKSYLESNNSAKDAAKASQNQLVMVAGMLKNYQHIDIRLDRSHQWMGEFIIKPPTILPGLHKGAFLHGGATSQGQLPVIVGSKAFLVYGQTVPGRPHRLGWLLAWSKPESPTEASKVYVEAGPVERLLKMESSEVLEKLEASGRKRCYWDPQTNAVAAAEIEDETNEIAHLGCSFGIIGVGIPPSQS